MEEILYIRIADCIVECRFHEGLYPFVRKEFVKRFKRRYGGFIYPNKQPEKAAARIDIKDYNKSQLITKKEGKTLRHYVYFFSQRGNSASTYYFISFAQLNIILRNLVQNQLRSHFGFQLHAAASLIRNKAVLFLGPNGAGKSTATSLLKSKFRPLADDACYVRKVGQSYYLYQTQEFEKQPISKSFDRYEISSVFFLHKSERNQIKPVTSEDTIYAKMIKQCNFYSAESVETEMKTLRDFSKKAQFYRLYFQKKRQPLIDLLK